ncbi:MAG: dihydropteroate synthase [Rickettsiales bacterium]|nr:dihydropteroate synthase [Rickettsiales bacterium]
MSKKILFLTGKLAERQLSRILDSMKPEFNYKINQIGVSVAALMSENIIMRRVTKEKGYDKIIVPGKFRGDLQKLSNFFDIPVERGPDDLTNLPDYFGLEYQEQNLKDNDCMIFSEIVDATILSVDQILNRAFEYKKDGADVIDLGCMPDTKFNHLEETIIKLKENGFLVSVDSANNDELLRGGKAGADYLLSISEKNVKLLDEVNSIPILIPAKQGDMISLERIIKKVKKMNRHFFADPILDPIHYGFADSISRFLSIRKKFPDINLLMGTGNLTELTDCDSTGVNTILMGLVSELNIKAVLVVQVSNHCRTSIKETDMARRLMFYAKKNQRLPIGINNNLMCLKDRKLNRSEVEEIRDLKTLIKDKNYRILLSEKRIHLFNKDILKTGTDPYDFFDSLDLGNDISHAFYLGVELSRAQIALQLGKNYNQDNELSWGILKTDEKIDYKVRPKIKSTQKK